MLNVMMPLKPGYQGAKELGKIRVARTSVGPNLYRAAMKGFSDALDAVVD